MTEEWNQWIRRLGVRDPERVLGFLQSLGVETLEDLKFVTPAEIDKSQLKFVEREKLKRGLLELAAQRGWRTAEDTGPSCSRSSPSNRSIFDQLETLRRGLDLVMKQASKLKMSDADIEKKRRQKTEAQRRWRQKIQNDSSKDEYRAKVRKTERDRKRRERERARQVSSGSDNTTGIPECDQGTSSSPRPNISNQEHQQANVSGINVQPEGTSNDVMTGSVNNHQQHIDLNVTAQSKGSVDEDVHVQKLVISLLEACISGDVNKVQQLLAAGASVNAEDWRGTALSRASGEGHIDVVRELLEHGADVEQREPLIEAAACGKLEVVKMLIQEGASLNAEDVDGDTALSRASGEGHTEVVRELLEHGADVEQGRWKPLIEAAKPGKLEVVRMLIQKGASVNAEDHDGYTALSHARYEEHTDVVCELLEHRADVEKGWRKPLIEAARSGKLEVVKMLIQKGASVNAPGHDTALSRASGEGHTDVVRELLEHGADVEQGRWKKPLIEAAGSGNLELVRMLIQKGASVNADFGWGHTALSHASFMGHTDVVRELLEHGADMGKGWRKPLIEAAQSGKLEVVRMLIQKGASVNAEDHDGYTALSHARYEEHPDVVRELLEHGADVEKGWRKPLIEAALSGELEVVKMLIQKGDYHC